MFTLKLTAAAVFAAILCFDTGCGNQPTHPNQINAFDGASYDSLTVAHAALTSLRSSVSTTHRQYIAPFNQAAESYATAYTAYTVFRAAQENQPALTLAMANLTVSIVSLENTFQGAMQVAPANVRSVRAQAARFRSAAAPRVSISDILAELEIAASVASTIPITEPYSSIAAIVIKMAQESIVAFTTGAGQPIDLATIQPVSLIQ